MKRPVVVICGAALDASARVGWGFECAACKIEGAWHESLNDTEDSARRHNRRHHQDEVASA